MTCVFAKVQNHPNIIIGGDFDLGDIDWNSTVPVPTNPNTAAQHQKFFQIVDDYPLTQHVKACTRPTSGKILYLLFTNYPNAIGEPSTETGLSDHTAVIFEVNLKPPISILFLLKNSYRLLILVHHLFHRFQIYRFQQTVSINSSVN